MQLWRSMMKLPQPVKGLFVLYVVVFAVTFVSVPVAAWTGQAASTDLTRWTFAALGVTAVLLGLALALDIRGSAKAYAGMLKDYKPMGVDYSGSFLAKPGFVRVFGALFASIGVTFIVAALFFTDV